MFKVSFKESENNPSKMVLKKGKSASILLMGKIDIPYFWSNMPKEIFDWISKQHNIELYENNVTRTLTIYSEGTAKCKDGDKFNVLLGERIAESKAKIHIYEFFYKLCRKLYDYCSFILFGTSEVLAKGKGGCLERTLYKYERLYKAELKHKEELIKSIKHE